MRSKPRRCSARTAFCARNCARNTASKISSAKATRSKQVFRIMEKVARTDSSVLITGESGTGKELVARAIHFTSERANSRFLPINCGALPENLLESELFGYKSGAFTGAGQDKLGLLKAADKGTIFFDEIGEMPLALQVKLLRALQERECYPLGSNDPVSFDVRVLCATNKNLEVGGQGRPLPRGAALPNQRHQHQSAAAARAQGRYPAARESFPAQVRKVARRAPRCAFPRARCACCSTIAWPGNVRELENTIERAAILAETDVIHSHDLPDKLRSPSTAAVANLESSGLDAGRARTRAYQARARQGRRRQGQGRAGAGHPSLDAVPQSAALPPGRRRDAGRIGAGGADRVARMPPIAMRADWI